MSRHRETSLPDDYTLPVLNEPGFSTGLTRDRPIPRTPAPVSRAPTLITNPSHRFASSSIVSTISAQTLVGDNDKRRYLSIQNDGGVDILLGFGVVAQLNGQNSYVLPAGVAVTFECGICPNNEVTVISSADCRVIVLEGMER